MRVATFDMARLRGIAEHQAGVVSRAQAHAAGLSDFSIRTRVASGAWQRVGRALVLRDMTESGDVHLAWLLTFNVSSDAVITGPLAARLGGWNLAGSELIVIDQHKRPAGIPGVRLLRRSPPAIAPGHNGLRVAHRWDAVADTLMCVPLERAEGVLDLVLQRRWLSPSDVELLVSQRAGHGRMGVKRLRHLQERASSGSRSEAERRMGRLLKRIGGNWIANYAIVDDDGRVLAEIDFAEPRLRIAIEVDGRAYHSDCHAFEHDRTRQNMIALGGWIILRFTWKRISEDPEGVIAEVARAIAIASASQI